MALGPQDNETFYREVDENLRRDQLAGWWMRYGKLLIGAVVVALLAFGGFLVWQNQRQKAAGADGEMLSAVITDLSQGKTAGIDKRLAPLLASSRDGYRAAARLLTSDVALDKSNADARAPAYKAAIAGYRGVAQDGGIDGAYRDLALIRQTALEFDSLPPQAVVDRLKPLAIAGNPWFGTAGEMSAIAYLRLGKPQLAAPLFAGVAKDEKAPQSLRSRAAQMAGMLGLDAAPALAAAAKE